jgi:hypothetical protein
MKRIIELADLHLDPKWIEQQQPCLDLILKTAKKIRSEDYTIPSVCIAGDIFNRAIYNSNKDKINIISDYFQRLGSIVPVIMVPGTPSHDAPGSYGMFERIPGCHVLKPNKPEIINGILYFCLLEINLINIMKKNNIDETQAIVKAQEKLKKLFLEYWLPVRIENKEIPAVFIGHGWFTDDINKENPVYSSSDIIIDNKILKKVQVDRHVFGHSHTPWESKVLNGGYVGYMGFDDHPWSNTGFQPGFNVTVFTGSVYGLDDQTSRYSTETKRIDFPVIRREKIKCTFDKVPDLSKHKDCDVRLNIKTDKKTLQLQNIKELENSLRTSFNLHSCVIFPDIIKEESSRITKEQAEKLKSLWEKFCFFKDWQHPQNHEGYMKKINEIEQNVSCLSGSQEKRIIELLSLKVKNSIFSLDSQNKNTFYHDFSKDPKGLTLISGENGKGKSTYFGFATTHPVFIGWDYKSLKEFFPEGGEIIKKFRLNNHIHKHLIIIPSNHKKAVKCYAYLLNDDNTTDILIETTAISEFFDFCERTYGSIETFIATSFFSQEPWRMKKYISSLVSATNTDFRNVYMSIVGIDRTNEKEYAKNKKDNLKNKIHDLEIKKNTMSEVIANKEEVEKELEQLTEKQKKSKTEILDLKTKKDKQFTEFKETEKEYNEQKIIENDIKSKLESRNNLEKERSETKTKIDELNTINIGKLKKQIVDNKIVKKEIEKSRNNWSEIFEKKISVEKISSELNKKISEINNSIKENNDYIKINNASISIVKETISVLKDPCPECGYIKGTEEITKKENEIKNMEAEIEKTQKENESIISTLKVEEREQKENDRKIDTINKQLSDIEENAKKLKLQLLSDEQEAAINKNIAEYDKITIYEETLNSLTTKIKNYNSEIHELEEKLNPFLSDTYNDKKTELEKTIDDVQEKQIEFSKNEGLLTSVTEQLEKIKTNEEKITEILTELDRHVINMTEWEIIEKDFMPNKYPSFELTIIASEIDFEVNQRLQGKFIIKTDTQYVNKKGEIIDRFDINIYNPVSGSNKSFLQYSPGQRAAFFSEPITQVLRDRRQRKEGIIYTWSVADETDNPIKYKIVKDYYESMKNALPTNHTRFIMSQKSEVYNYITATIDIESIGINT